MLSGKSVLVVEDAALIAVDIETMLEELGVARVVMAGGGETVIPLQTDSGVFDMAVIDVHTAESIGGNHVGELDRAGVPVIFLATDPEAEGIPPFEGPHSVVLKPFTYEDLCAAIVRLIG